MCVFISYSILQTPEINTKAIDETESVPSRATDVPSTLKDSGYGDVANESSRNLSPEDEAAKLPNLLQTITDGLEEDEEEPERAAKEKPGVKLIDKPELISPDFTPDYIDSRFVIL